jgi:uncharacterized protein YndB with AHSA1/START domain
MPNPAVITTEDAVISEIEIAAPPERVFQALIDREQALRWGTNDAFEIKSWEMDARAGGKWRFVPKERSGKGAVGDDFEHHGEILQIDPPRLLVYSWFANWHAQPLHKTVVRWDLTPTPAGTKVKVTHSGLAQLPDASKGYSEGWPGLLQELKNFFEK